jgi:cytochrome P450
MRRQLLAEFVSLRTQFGDVVRLPLFPHPVYLLSHPDTIQHVLRDNASNYRKGVLFQPIAALQGQGLLTSEGALWRQQRRLTQQALHQRHLPRFAPIVVEEAQAVVQRWCRMAHTGKPVNVAAWMHRLTFRIAGRLLLGITPENLDDVGQQLQAVGQQLFPYLTSPITHTWTLPAWIRALSQWRFRRAVAIYQAIAQQLIVTRRQALQRDRRAATDMLALLITASDEATHSSLTEQQLRDEVITFIGASVETAAQALSWTWYLLARYPDVAQRVHREVDTVLGTCLPTLADLSRLPFCRMVLDEAMRLYPPAAILPRQANTEDEVGGYTVRKNTVLLMSPYVTHRHAEFWPDPEHFNPERFAPESLSVQHRFAYIPFGEGPRICIGRSLALLELHLILVVLAQSYRLELITERPVVPSLATTLQPAGGLWMTVQARW